MDRNVNGVNIVNMSNDTRDQRRAELLDRIAVEALLLVQEGGLEGLTMARLGQRVSYTAPALYRYFPSKGALLAELNRRVLQAHLERLVAAGAPSLPPVEALRCAAQVLVAHAAADPGALGLVALTMADPRNLVEAESRVHLPVLLALVQQVAGWIGAAQDQGQVRPGDSGQRALQWTFGLLGTLQLAKLTRFDPRLDAGSITLAMADDLLSAWSAPPSFPSQERTS
jgi:AcrR family transcriptional regulator